MRKRRNGLSAIIDAHMDCNVYSRSLFVFLNKRRNIIRFLYWDHTGFALWTKTLDKERFKWPSDLFEGSSLTIEAKMLELILKGMDISLHKKLDYDGTL